MLKQLTSLWTNQLNLNILILPLIHPKMYAINLIHTKYSTACLCNSPHCFYLQGRRHTHIYFKPDVFSPLLEKFALFGPVHPLPKGRQVLNENSTLLELIFCIYKHTDINILYRLHLLLKKSQKLWIIYMNWLTFQRKQLSRKNTNGISNIAINSTRNPIWCRQTQKPYTHKDIEKPLAHTRTAFVVVNIVI